MLQEAEQSRPASAKVSSHEWDIRTAPEPLT
jgi:hypothetical protein